MDVVRPRYRRTASPLPLAITETRSYGPFDTAMTTAIVTDPHTGIDTIVDRQWEVRLHIPWGSAGMVPILQGGLGHGRSKPALHGASALVDAARAARVSALWSNSQWFGSRATLTWVDRHGGWHQARGATVPQSVETISDLARGFFSTLLLER